MLSHRISGEILVQTGEGRERRKKPKWMGSVPQNCANWLRGSKHNPGSNNQVGRMPKEMLHTWKICCEMAVEQHLECIRIAAFKSSVILSAQGPWIWHVTWLLAPRTTAYLLSHFFKLLLMPPRDLHSTHKTCRLEIQGLCGFTEKMQMSYLDCFIIFTQIPVESWKIRLSTVWDRMTLFYWPLRIYCYLKLQMLM